MKNLAIEEIFEIEGKSSLKAGDGLKEGHFPFYTSSQEKIMKINIALYEGPAIILGTGGKASVHYCEGQFSTSADCYVLKPKNKSISTKAIAYFLNGYISILEKGFRGAGLKHISKKYITSILVPYIENESGKKIIGGLDNVNELIIKRQQSIQKLDELLHSVFYDMFMKGYDKYQWPDMKIEDMTLKDRNSMRTGPFGSDLLHSELVDEGVAVIGIDNVVTNKFVWNKSRFITPAKYEKLKRYTLYPGDIVITIMGTLGRCAVIPNDIPPMINTKHLAAITLDKNIANPIFLSFAFTNHPEILHQLKTKTKGAIMGGLNLGIIKSIHFKLPPIDDQESFSNQVRLVQLQKEKAEKSLKRLENLFQSLLQQSFSGETNQIYAN